MSRIVITSFGSYGDVNPYLGLALALRARGHDPVLATSPFYRDYVQAEIGIHVAVRAEARDDDATHARSSSASAVRFSKSRPIVATAASLPPSK